MMEHLLRLVTLVAAWIAIQSLTPASAALTAVSTPMVELRAELLAALPDPSIRPVINHNISTVVDVDMEIRQLIDVNEVGQKITLALSLTYHWRSEFAIWNPLEYDGILEVYMDPTKIWVPLFAVTTSVEHLRAPEVIEETVQMSHDGNMEWSTHRIVTYTCLMNMSYFPTDKHTCRMIMRATHDKSPAIKFGKVQAVEFIYGASSEYSVSDIEAQSMRGANAILSLSIERNPIMIDNTILKPLSLLSIIPSASLLLPSDEGAKLDIQIATMLAYSFFMMILSDFIPPYDESSKPQLVDFMTKLVTVNMFAIIYTILILRLSTFDGFSPSKQVYKGFIFIGNILLIHHPQHICRRKIRSFSDKSDTSKKITVESCNEGDSKACDDNSTNLQLIADWMNENKRDEETRYQWNYIGAVLDRVFFIILLSLSLYLGYQTGSAIKK